MDVLPSNTVEYFIYTVAQLGLAVYWEETGHGQVETPDHLQVSTRPQLNVCQLCYLQVLHV